MIRRSSSLNPDPPQPRPQPSFGAFDRWTLGLALVLALAIGLVLWRGDHGTPRIRDFNWQGRQVGGMDRALLFTFSRPMDQASVEANFRIQPPLAGKFSWAGRRMAYTLTEPVPYGGQVFEVRIDKARDRFGSPGASPLQPFLGQFQSRDRALVYVGVTGEEESRLVLYNVTREERRILTPPELSVLEFEPYPGGDRLLFSATDRSGLAQGQFDPKLYTVTTGIVYNQVPTLGDQTLVQDLAQSLNPRSTPSPAPPGTIRQILDSDTYQNLKFDLAPNGTTIVVQRSRKDNPGVDFGLWVIEGDNPAKPLKTAPGGEFLIAPDSQSLIMAQGQGLAVLPLDPAASPSPNPSPGATASPLRAEVQPLDFLPQFGQVLSLSSQGDRAAMVRFNNDYTRSLFLVTNQGIQRELWRTDGSILSATFDPNQQRLYGLVTRLIPGDTYQEAPFLIAIDLATALKAPEPKPDQPFQPQGIQALARLATQRDITVSLAPDGLALVFDQILSQEDQGTTEPKSSDGKSIRDSQLWVLPIVIPPPNTPPDQVSLPNPEPLPMKGIRPRWLP